MRWLRSNGDAELAVCWVEGRMLRRDDGVVEVAMHTIHTGNGISDDKGHDG